MGRIKDECFRQGPKETVECLSSDVAGVVGATAPGQLPCSEKEGKIKREVWWYA